jgi:hypothetical protein
VPETARAITEEYVKPLLVERKTPPPVPAKRFVSLTVRACTISLFFRLFDSIGLTKVMLAS